MYAPTAACGLFFIDPFKRARNICVASQVHRGRAQLLPNARVNGAISAAVAARSTKSGCHQASGRKAACRPQTGL